MWQRHPPAHVFPPFLQVQALAWVHYPPFGLYFPIVYHHLVPGGASSPGVITTLTNCRVLSYRLLWSLKYEFWKFLTSSFWDMETLMFNFWQPWKSIYIFWMFWWYLCGIESKLLFSELPARLINCYKLNQLWQPWSLKYNFCLKKHGLTLISLSFSKQRGF